MYRNLDECLQQTYKILSVELSPKGNTGAVMQWCESKGVILGGGQLSQSEYHANAVMIASQVAQCLNRPVLTAVVECQYGKTDGLMIIAGCLVANGACDDVAMTADLLRHIYSDGKNPRRTWIMDKYDLANSTFVRKRKKMTHYLAKWEQQARFQLNENFCKKGIISA